MILKKSADDKKWDKFSRGQRVKHAFFVSASSEGSGETRLHI